MEEKIISWLLGELSEKEDLAMESELLSDEEKFNQVLAIQNDLLDRYARGQLTTRQRESFQRRLEASPWLQRRATKSVLLKKYLSTLSPEAVTTTATVKETPATIVQKENKTETKNSWQRFWEAIDAFATSNRYGFASLTLFLLAGCGLLLFETARLRTKVVSNEELNTLKMQLKMQKEQNSQLQRDLANRTTTENSNVSLSVELLEGSSNRNNQPQQIDIPTSFNIDIKLTTKKLGNTNNLRVELLTLDKSVVWSRDQLSVKQAGGTDIVPIQLSSELLKESDYILRLSEPAAQGEFKEIASYNFKVVKR